MPLPDYQERVERMQRGLGRAVQKDVTLLNIPGRSLACKIDPLYYLAVQPLFDQALERWAGLPPGAAADALVRTGIYVTRPPKREHVLPLNVTWGNRFLRIQATFVDADFVDKALKIYSGARRGVDVSELRIDNADREQVERLFQNKTAPGGVAFAG